MSANETHPYAKQGAKIWQMRQEAGIPTQQEAADLIGISLRSFNNYERGASEMPRHKWIAMEASFAAYANRGETAIADNATRAYSPAVKSRSRAATRIKTPVFDMATPVGKGGLLDEARIIGEIDGSGGTIWIAPLGDSMEPTITVHAARQAVRFNGDAEDIHVDGIYVFRLEQGYHIKRLQLRPGRRLRVISDNPRYEPYELDLAEQNDFEVVARLLP